jgi:hypothetical protein
MPYTSFSLAVRKGDGTRIESRGERIEQDQDVAFLSLDVANRKNTSSVVL